jgi:hypothetical protein
MSFLVKIIFRNVATLADPDPNPDPDLLVRDTDPDQLLPSSNKNSKKNIDSYCFGTSL